MKKGQTAMEYLMTYGWAILIILIVGGLLVYYGVFSLKPGASKTGFGQIDIVSPWDYNAGGQLRIRLQNNLGQPLNVTAINITDPASSTYPATLNNVYNGVTYGYTLNTGGTSTFLTGSSGVAINSTVTGSSGDPYTIKVTIIYVVAGQSFTSTGQLGGTRS
jgi:uncharacterized protein (UPF0333 family)